MVALILRALLKVLGLGNKHIEMNTSRSLSSRLHQGAADTRVELHTSYRFKVDSFVLSDSDGYKIVY